MSLMRTLTALGAFYRRLTVRIGKPKAITATARKLALLVYRVLSGDLVYQDPGANAYHQFHLARELESIRRRATQFGYDLIDRRAPARYSSILFLRRRREWAARLRLIRRHKSHSSNKDFATETNEGSLQRTFRKSK
jgi:hypothetical protein